VHDINVATVQMPSTEPAKGTAQRVHRATSASLSDRRFERRRQCSKSGGSLLEFGAALNEKVTSALGASDTLQLDGSQHFKGTFARLTAADTLDLGDISFATLEQPTYLGARATSLFTIVLLAAEKLPIPVEEKFSCPRARQDNLAIRS